MISLVTSRLVLRPLTEADAQVSIDMATDAEVMKFIADGNPLSPKVAAERFETFLAMWGKNGFGPLAVEPLNGGEVVGFVGLGVPDFLPDILPAVEIGWRFRRSSWGQGYATEAAGTLVDWAFENLEVDSLVSVIGLANERSRRVATKLGMQLERRTVLPEARTWVEVYECHSTDEVSEPASAQ